LGCFGAMRIPRVKVNPDEGEGVYHCISRVVAREHLLDAPAREVLRRMFWQIADYTGVQILTYAILSNHFHVLVRVPRRSSLSDAELLRRYRVLYPKPTPYQHARAEVIENMLLANSDEAQLWRERQQAMMGDVSAFMKLVKQRFSIWYNRHHERVGTLWCERFKSVLVEPRGRTVEAVSVYIDLNAVRAGLVNDPKDYRFCGYAEAVGGRVRARRGLMSVVDEPEWSKAQMAYRQVLFGSGAAGRAGSATVDVTSQQAVVRGGGELTAAVSLGCRLRYMTEGAVLGSRHYVEDYMRRRAIKRRRLPEPRAAGELAHWGALTTLRHCRDGPAKRG
jgi:putative transposase